MYKLCASIILLTCVSAFTQETLNDQLAKDPAARQALTRLCEARENVRQSGGLSLADRQEIYNQYRFAFNNYLSATRDIRARWNAENASVNPSAPARFSK